MKNLLLTIFFITASTITLYAQGNNRRARIPEKIEIDKSVIEVVYSHGFYDNNLDEDFDEEIIVQVGKKVCQCNNYASYCIDSIIISLNTPEITQGFYDNLWKRFPRIIPTLFATLIDKRAKQVEVAARMPFDGNYKYKEDYLPMKWILSNEAKDVLGHNCRKATCKFRGIEWTAWFAPDIKYSYGPWRLGGLPGMILAAESADGSHKFEAIGIRNKSTPIIMDERLSRGHYEKDRKSFLKHEKESKLHGSDWTWKAYEEDPLNHPKPAIKHFPYVPFELE